MVQTQISSDVLQQTDIVASLDSETISGRNLVYCATFQLVWNELADEIIKSPIELNGNLQLVQSLNKRLFEKRDISPSCYLAMAGFGQNGIVEQIQHELRERFHREPELDIQIPPDGILAYAYLEKSLLFETKFDVYSEPLLFDGKINVQSFGVAQNSTASSQIAILDYYDSDNFILKFQKLANADTDEIVLAKVTPKSTLVETVESVLSRVDEKSNSPTTRKNLETVEKVQIPKLCFNILREYRELEGKFVLNQGFQDYFIAVAQQVTKFQLDETGANLSSEALMKLLRGIAPEPRKFVFDKPFLLFIKEPQSRFPYLALWIDNSELLVKA